MIELSDAKLADIKRDMHSGYCTVVATNYICSQSIVNYTGYQILTATQWPAATLPPRTWCINNSDPHCCAGCESWNQICCDRTCFSGMLGSATLCPVIFTISSICCLSSRERSYPGDLSLCERLDWNTAVMLEKAKAASVLDSAVFVVNCTTANSVNSLLGASMQCILTNPATISYLAANGAVGTVVVYGSALVLAAGYQVLMNKPVYCISENHACCKKKYSALAPRPQEEMTRDSPFTELENITISVATATEIPTAEMIFSNRISEASISAAIPIQENMPRAYKSASIAPSM